MVTQLPTLGPWPSGVWVGFGTADRVGGGAWVLGAAAVAGELVAGAGGGEVAAMLLSGLPPVPLAGVLPGDPGQAAGALRWFAGVVAIWPGKLPTTTEWPS